MSKRYKVVISRRARRSLQRIEDYLKENASTPTAKRVKAGLVAEVRKLTTLPERHPILRKSKDGKKTYRYVVKWSYKIIYRVKEEDPTADQVLVLELFHSSQDPEKLEDILD